MCGTCKVKEGQEAEPNVAQIVSEAKENKGVQKRREIREIKIKQSSHQATAGT